MPLLTQGDIMNYEIKALKGGLGNSTGNAYPIFPGRRFAYPGLCY